MLKIGVIGAGHLGKIHIKCINEIPEFELSGFFDNDKKNAEAVAKEFGINCNLVWLPFSLSAIILEANGSPIKNMAKIHA